MLILERGNGQRLLIAAYTFVISLQPSDESYFSNRSAACYLKLNKNQEAVDDAVICRYLKRVKG